MLTKLRIQSLALIDDVELSFDDGLSVLTGETGAGKSIVVNALSLALGARAETEHIRYGSNKATVEATFSLKRLPAAVRKQYAAYTQDDELTVVREISRTGNSKVRVNGESGTVGQLRELTAPLAEILGQHSNQMLMDESNHLLFLDRFAASETQREVVTELYTKWEKARFELKKTRARREELVQERELLLFQAREIQEADIRIGEEDKLVAERKILDSSTTLIEAASRIQEILGGETDSLTDQLKSARRELDRMAQIDSTLDPQVQQLTELDFQVEELRGFVEQYGSAIQDNPHRLEAINMRLDEIYRLKQKYGGSEESVLQKLKEAEEALDNNPETASLLAKLERDDMSCRADYTEKAIELSDIRSMAASYLCTLVIKELGELAIENGGFEFKFEYTDHSNGVELHGRKLRPTPLGLETGQFLFSANPGEPLKSLVKTASGGEISRVLLALKAAEKKNNRRSRSLLVFDEVDAGVGGRTALAVAEKIKRLSEFNQVIVVTHLHQIARLANHHYVATKSSLDQRRTRISVARLESSDVGQEIDRMVALPD